MRRFIAGLAIVAFLAPAAASDADEEIFSPGDHCVAYRTVKDVLFAIDAEIIGRNCDVSASLVASEGGAGPRVVVSVPIKRFKSRNFLRDRSVADLLGAKTQPDLRFASAPIDVEAVRTDLAGGSFRVSGVLTIGGKDFRPDRPPARGSRARGPPRSGAHRRPRGLGARAGAEIVDVRRRAVGAGSPSRIPA
jgi:hypothetical protein